MKEHGNEFWKDVLARVATARADAGEEMSLEEAERRLAEVEDAEVAPLSAARIDRIVEAATGKGGASRGGGRETGGRVLRLPVWTRRAVAAGLLVAPLVAVAFWRAFREENRPTIPYFEDPDAPLDYPRAMFWLSDREATLRVAAEYAGPGQSHEEWATKFRARAQGRVFQYLAAAVTALRELRRQPGEIGTVAEAALSDLVVSLDAPLLEERIDIESIVPLLTRAQASDAPASERVAIIGGLVPQLAAGVHALRQTLSEGGELQTKGNVYLSNLRSELSR